MTILERLQKLNQERALLLDTLRLWDEAALQGLSYDEVVSFSFRDVYLTPSECMVQYQSRRKIWPETHHNAVRLKDGSWRELKPPLRRPTSQPHNCSVGS